jgi:hypothetical protein
MPWRNAGPNLSISAAFAEKLEVQGATCQRNGAWKNESDYLMHNMNTKI